MTVQARDYLRVSLDKSGRARSLDEQHSEHLQAAERNGWTLGKSYRDESVSASRYTTKARKGYARLVADLESGEFAADILIMWEASRGSRRVGEWVLLCDLLAEQGVHVHVKTHGRTYDPANPRDRRTLLEDAVDSEYESGKTSGRVRRDAEAQAREGRAPWRGAFGHPRRERVGEELVPVPPERLAAEAEAVRRTYAGLFAGRTLTSLARDLNERGFRSTLGGEWNRTSVRELLENPRHAGLRYYKGERIGQGQWEALVPEETWRAAVNLLGDPKRRTSSTGSRKWLGSTLYRCGVQGCGKTMRIKYNGQSARLYQCSQGHNYRDGNKTDAYVREVIALRLAQEDITTLLGADDGAELASLHADASALRSRLDSLGADYAIGNLTGNQVRVATERIEASLAEADEKIAAIGRRNQLAGMLSSNDAARQFLDADLDVQRATVDALAVVTILPTYRGRRSDISETVRIEPRSAEHLHLQE